MKSLRKDLFREIAKTKGRFFSILLIVAIGVAFFTGVTTSADIMQQNIDRYYDDTHFRDFQIFSTLGFSEDDVQALQAFPGLDKIHASKALEALVKQGESELAFKVVSLPSEASREDQSYVDQWRLVEGRMPKAANEAVLKASVFEEGGYQIGDTITLTHPDNSLDESLSELTYTIVGMVESPNYMSFEMGNSTMGAGSIRGVLAVPETNFTTDFYTEMLLTMDGAASYNSFTSEYFDFLADKEAQLVQLGEQRATIRFEEIKDMALSKIEEGEMQF
ncbi:MAG: ABC transporter permease, partial [Erysipelotrichaceae bacterium]